MFLVDRLILVTGLLVLLGIASSKFSSRFGMPVLVLFLTLGMLAGSEGIGGIDFENYSLAHAIGTISLAVILFDGGLSTPLSSIKAVWKPAAMLATGGVLITAVLTGVAAAYILDISLLKGLLLGSIVSSTDAAAVFSILRSGGTTLPDRLSATLEVESGSNDPMAIFLTLACIQLLSGQMEFGLELMGLFTKQMLFGLMVGGSLGYCAVWVVNRINLVASGLYPVLVSAFSLLTFGVTAWLGGSGFLAVYVAGIVLGNNQLAFKRGIFLFHDATAWLAQIVMFVVLGLLSFPSRLLAVSAQGLMIAAALTFIARPAAVLLMLIPFHYNWRELTLLSWVGLKGAVPVTLATFPLIFNIVGAEVLFDVVFFVVVISALIQGWTLPYAAERLGLKLPAQPPPPVTLEISSLRHVEGDIVDYAVSNDSRAAGRRVRELALPEGVVMALIARDDQIIPPQGNTQIQPGDHVVLVLRPGTRPLVNQVFGRVVSPHDDLPELLEFPLRGTIRVAELEEFYGIRMNADPATTLDQAIRERLGDTLPNFGTIVRFGAVALHVRRVDSRGQITQVGMVVLPEEVLLQEELLARRGADTEPAPLDPAAPSAPPTTTAAPSSDHRASLPKEAPTSLPEPPESVNDHP
jgi:cell volume regulation protein A